MLLYSTIYVPVFDVTVVPRRDSKPGLSYLKPQLLCCGGEADWKLSENTAFAVSKGIEVRQISPVYHIYSFTSIYLSPNYNKIDFTQTEMIILPG